jgi:phospholipase/lecithinase/hemolysin
MFVINSDFCMVFQGVFLSTVFLTTLTPPARAGNFGFTEIYVFGDSNTDLGRVYQGTGGTFPPSPPYSEGRFTNGPVWVEYLAESLGLPINPNTNFAFGGATTGTVNTVSPSFPGGLTQVNQYITANPQADPNGLYILALGVNDYLFNGLVDPNEAVGNLESAILALTNIGAKNILVSNFADLGKTPLGRSLPNSSQLSNLSQLHGSVLSHALEGLQNTLPAGVRLFPVDLFTNFNTLAADPVRFGFVNATDPCLVTSPSVSICSNPDRYFFWDNVHPSTAGQRAIATVALSSLSSIPEPSNLLPLLTILGLGLVTLS